MSNHTRVDIEATDDYECAFGDCGHEVRPCPTSTWDCCRECTDRSWDQYEGGVVTWDECKGVGASFAEQELDDACLDELDLPTRSAERCSMCRDGVSHSARCHHDEHEVCDRVAEGTDAPKSCACPCHSPGYGSHEDAGTQRRPPRRGLGAVPRMRL